MLFPVRRVSKIDPALKWETVEVTRTEPICGFIAGAVVPVEVHWGGASKPCRTKLTAGRLKCPFCKAKAKRREIGYQPIFTSDGIKIVVPLSQTAAEEAQDFPFGHPVKLMRGKGATDRVRFYAWSPDEKQKKHLVKLMTCGSQDITKYLCCKLWGDSTLEKFLTCEEKVKEYDMIVDRPTVPMLHVVAE